MATRTLSIALYLNAATVMCAVRCVAASGALSL